jgi:hypothetical protein
MRIPAASASLIVAWTVLVSAQMPQPAPGGGRWWNVPAGKLLEDRAKVHKKRYPESTEQVDQLVAKYEAKINAYRTRIDEDLRKLDGEREELRKKGYQASGRQAWQVWFERDRELYKPVEAILADFGKELNDLVGSTGETGADRPVAPSPGSGGATALPAVKGAAPMPLSGGAAAPAVRNPYLPSGLPTPAPRGPAGSRGPWASAEQVEAMLGKLPPEPPESRLQEVFDRFKARGKIPADDADRAAKFLKTAQEEFRNERMSRADEIGQVQRAIRVIKAHPASIRVADLRTVRDHWMEIVDSLKDLIDDLETDLTDLEE